MLSKTIFPIAYQRGEWNPLAKYRVPLDWATAFFSLYLVTFLVAAFQVKAVSSVAASNLLLSVMVVYFVGELLARFDVLLKPFGLICFCFGLLVYISLARDIATIETIFQRSVEPFTWVLLVAVPVALYFATQRGTYHHRAAVIGFGFFSLISWIAVLMARGIWEHIDRSGQLLIFVLLAFSMAMIIIPNLVESVALKVSWPMSSVTYLAIKESEGNFEHVLQTLIQFMSIAAIIIFASVALVFGWKRIVAKK